MAPDHPSPSHSSTPSSTPGPRAAEPLGTYAHARCVRGGGVATLYLAGLGPRSRGSRVIPGVVLRDGHVESYDIAPQVRACFENVRLVLAEAGFAWTDIVDVTVYMTDIPRDFATFNRLWAEAFPDPATAPCRTTVQVAALPQGGEAPINVELKVVAARAER
jgi:2-aminomuconate deaminase